MEVYFPLRRVFGHRVAWAAECALARLTGRRLCDSCGDTARYPVAGRYYCRPCAWQQADGQPASDPDSEPPGAGADPFGRPDPITNPEYWRE